MSIRAFMLFGCAALSFAARGATPEHLLETWEAAVRSQSPSFTGFSAERGKTLYFTQPSDWSCSTCHTADPQGAGRHTVTGKAIKPLSPAVNPTRFTDAGDRFRRCGLARGRNPEPRGQRSHPWWLERPCRRANRHDWRHVRSDGRRRRSGRTGRAASEPRPTLLPRRSA